MPTIENKKDIRYIAAQLLDLFGASGKHWIQDTLEDGRGNYCLMGGMEELKLESNVLLEAVRKETGYSSVESFNDENQWPTIKAFLCKYIRPKKVQKGKK